MIRSKDFVEIDIPMITAWIKRNVKPGERITTRQLYQAVCDDLQNPISASTFAVYFSSAKTDGFLAGLLEGRGRAGYRRVSDRRQALTAPVRSIVNLKKDAMKDFIAFYGTDTVGITLLGLAAKLDLSPQYLDTLRDMTESLTKALRESAE